MCQTGTTTDNLCLYRDIGNKLNHIFLHNIYVLFDIFQKFIYNFGLCEIASGKLIFEGMLYRIGRKTWLTLQLVITIHRNQIKVRNLDAINSTTRVFNLPIEAYYFSCNLDHVLYEERNLEQSLKETYAFDFADRYEDKESEFIDFVGDRSLSFSFNYKDTWTKIKQGNNSLLKHTNLIVFFLNNIDLLKEEIREKVETEYLK